MAARGAGRRRLLAVLVAAAAAAAAGCASIENRKRADLLAQRARDYVRAVRWGDFAAAAAFLRPRDGSAPALDMARLKQIRVTGDEHVVAAVSDEDTEARMQARFEYQPPSSATVRSVEQSVLWWYEPAEENWFVDGTLPAF